MALQPAMTDAWLKLADVCERLGDHIAALKCWRRLTELEPGNPASHARLGNALLQAGDHAGTVESYRTLSRLAPGTPESWHNLSLALRHDHRPQEARDACERALSLRTDHPAALLNRGILLEHEGDLDGAAASYRQALAGEPTCTAAY